MAVRQLRAVYVHYLQTLVGNHGSDPFRSIKLSMLVNADRCREKKPDITQTGCTQQCIAYRMDQHIRIRMAGQAFLERYRTPPITSFPLNQAVNVITVSNSHCPLPAQYSSHIHIVRGVIFRLR